MKLLLPYNFHNRLSDGQFIKILNFLKNQRVYLLKANEVMEIFMFNLEFERSMNITEISISQIKHVSDCKKNCNFKFSLWNSKQNISNNKIGLSVLEENCFWDIIDLDSGSKIIPDEIDFKNQKIIIKKEHLLKSFYISLSLKCKSRQIITIHLDELSDYYEKSIPIKISRDLLLSSIQVDVVKGKSIPELKKNKFFNCRSLSLKASQYDVLYAIVDFDKISKPDPLRDSVFVQLTALEIFDNFRTPNDKSKILYSINLISSKNRRNEFFKFNFRYWVI